MTPSEQDALFTASITRDLDEVAAAFLHRVRSRANQRIVERKIPGRS